MTLPRISRSLLLAAALLLAPRIKAQTTPPLSLPQAIQLGIAHHPLAASAQANIARAAAQLAQARAARLPTLSAAQDLTLSDDPVFAFGTKLRQARFASSDFDLSALNHPSPIGNFTSSATASWLAFDSGTTRKQIQSTQSASRSAALAQQYTQQQVAALITQLYYRLLLAESQTSVAQTNLDRAQEVAASIEDRVRSGLALESDGMRASLSIRQAQDDLAAAHDNIQLARRDLFAAIGQPVSDVPLLPPDVTASQPASAPPALTTRLDIQSIEMQQQAARQSLASIRATAGPRLSTFGLIQSDNPHLIGGGSTNWTVGAKLEISVFDGQLRKAREREAQAQLQSLAASEQQTLLTARSTIAALETQLADLQRREATATSAIQVNQEALQTVRDRYNAGLVTVSELLAAESDLSAAEFAKDSLFYQRCIANANLQLATGTISISKAGQP